MPNMANLLALMGMQRPDLLAQVVARAGLEPPLGGSGDVKSKEKEKDMPTQASRPPARTPGQTSPGGAAALPGANILGALGAVQPTPANIPRGPSAPGVGLGSPLSPQLAQLLSFIMQRQVGSRSPRVDLGTLIGG